MSGTFIDLEVWQAAMDLVTCVYRLSGRFPNDEMYGLKSQFRRAAVSIPSNIAEGKGRSSDRELTQFLCHARGSLFEVETQLEIAERLTYITKEESESLRCEATSRSNAKRLNSFSAPPRMKPKAGKPKAGSRKPRAEGRLYRPRIAFR